VTFYNLKKKLNSTNWLKLTYFFTLWTSYHHFKNFFKHINKRLILENINLNIKMDFVIGYGYYSYGKVQFNV
jgi:hypothetical protein